MSRARSYKGSYRPNTRELTSAGDWGHGDGGRAWHVGGANTYPRRGRASSPDGEALRLRFGRSAIDTRSRGVQGRQEH